MSQNEYQRSFETTQGEKLMRITNPILFTIIFGIIPLSLLGYLVVFFGVEGNFISRLGYGFALVYVLGGFFIGGLKIHQHVDRKFGDVVAGKRKSLPMMKKMFFKIILPEGFDRPVGDMYNFFNDISAINADNYSNLEKYFHGKRFYDLAFDYIIKDGKLEMFFSVAYKRLGLIQEAFKKNYPEIVIVECENPYKDWPQKWDERGDYFDKFEPVEVIDYSYSKGGDFLTLANPDFFKEGNQNPLGDLLNSFLQFDPKAIIVWQIVLRKTANSKEDKNKEDLQKMKIDTLSKNAKINGKDSTVASGDLITAGQKSFFDYLDQAVGEGRWKTHLRVAVFAPKGKSYYTSALEKFIASFSSKIAFGRSVEKVAESATNRLYSDTGFFDTVVGPLANRYYHSKENEYRRKSQYIGLIGQRLNTGADSGKFVIDTKSLPSLVCFPKIPTFVDEKNSVASDIIKSQVQSFSKLQELRKANQDLEYNKIEPENK